MRGCQESPNRASEGCARGSNKVRARERAAVLRLFALRKQASALSPRRSSSARTLLMKPIATAVPPYSSAASRPSDLGREVPSLRRGGFSESELAGLAAAPPAELSTSCGGARCCAALCAAGRSPAPMLSAARRAARNAVRAEKRRTAGHGTLRHPLLGTAGDVSGACRGGVCSSASHHSCVLLAAPRCWVAPARALQHAWRAACGCSCYPAAGTLYIVYSTLCWAGNAVQS